MKRKVLLIDTSTENLSQLSPLLAELAQRNFDFSIMSGHSAIINKYRLKQWPAHKFPCFLNLNKTWQVFLFLFLGIIIIPASFFFLLYLKYSKKIKTIISCHHLEKLIFTKIGRLLKIKIVWLEFPGSANNTGNKLLKKLLKNNSRFAETIVFSGLAKQRLIQAGRKAEKITVISPGIRRKNLMRQDNIFNELAQVESQIKKRKFFTIGVITKLENKKLGEKMEKLLKAIKKSLVVIPNMQIIIVGDGEERKNLNWLVKKMEIDNLVWFIGGSNETGQGTEKHLKKWLDSFDLFISVSNDFDLNDYFCLLHALGTGLPTIAPSHIGLEDIILDNENGVLINTEDSEILTQKIISLQQNKNLRQKLSDQAEKNIQENFTIEKMTYEFEKLL